MDPRSNAILDACNKFTDEKSCDNFYVGEHIPDKKLNNFIAACESSGVDVRDDEFLALVDSTVFGSAKCGVAFGLSGLYCRNDWTAESKSGYISWDRLLAEGDPRKGASCEVLFIPHCDIGANLAGSDVSQGDFLQLIRRIRDGLQSMAMPSPVPSFVPPVPAIPAIPSTWTCDWCERINDGKSSVCAGCGAPRGR